MTGMSRRDYIAVARAVRDSGAAFESKTRITDALVASFSEEDDRFVRHVEVFEAIALSPERGA